MKLLDEFDRALFVTVGLGIALFCVSSGDTTLAVIAIPLWAVSWIVTQGPRGAPLPRPVVFALVLAATASVMLGVLRDTDRLIPEISRYLVWLHLIKLFDRVEPRDKAQLLMMSMFLALGASLTSSSVLLGVALLVYLPIFLWTLMLHQLHAGARSASEAQATLPPDARRRAQRLAPAGSRLRRDFSLVVSAAGVTAFLVSAAVFILTPRQSAAALAQRWTPPPAGAVTGFTEEVSLGGEGIISESTATVLELRVHDGDGRDLGPDLGKVLLRGAVLDSYKNGHWTRSEQDPRVEASGVVFAGQRLNVGPSATRNAQTYVQEITFRNKAPGPVFAMYRPIAFQWGRQVSYKFGRTDSFIESNASGRMSYTVVSQPDGASARVAVSPRLGPLFRQGPIHDLAQRLMTQAGLTRDPSQRHTPDDERIVEAFQSYLERGFVYTTKMAAPSQDEDPIEMFLFRTRRGHCEYFASGLTSMCRSVGIDARVVTGYVASEYNDSGGFFQVREMNAHAWTEALTAPGLWKTFDPSPAAGVALAQRTPGGVRGALLAFKETVERFWLDRLVNYDEPQRQRLLGASSAQTQARTMTGVVGAVGQPWSLGRVATGVAKAIGQGVAVFALVGAIGLIGSRLVAWFAGWIRRRLERSRAVARDPALGERLRQTAFFARLMRRLDRAGIGRPQWRSPLAHARQLDSVDPPLSRASCRLVELYYSARYGHRALSPAEEREADELMSSVQRRLQEVKRARHGAIVGEGR